jgi:diguanylate cyclase (GGDEF)-like protein
MPAMTATPRFVLWLVAALLAAATLPLAWLALAEPSAAPRGARAALAAVSAVAALFGAVTAAAAAWTLRHWQRALAHAVAQSQRLAQGRAAASLSDAPSELRGVLQHMHEMADRLQALTEAQAQQVAMLQRQAQTDAVTGLPLRAQFMGRLHERLADAGAPPVALVLLRVQQLDALNARNGFEATDRLLGAIADLLQAYVQRVPGTFAGRLGGSDFALCLPVADVAEETARSLHEALASAPLLHSAGVEVALGAADALVGLSASDALAAADAALARAEAEGGVAVERPADGADRPVGARAWRAQIAEALEAGRVELGEFPVLDRRGALIHLESPLRVRLEADGPWLPAARWLALARRTRLLPQVDLTALDLALAAIAADGRPRAVHVASASLQLPGFVEQVGDRLATHPHEAAKVSLEWVEGARAGSAGPDRGAIAALQAAAARWAPLGATLGVEHAGAAPQQLPALRAAGIRYVKVDPRHLRGAADDGAVRHYAQGLLTLIHGLGLQALAEGVADERTLQALWTLGFDGATGPALGGPQQ